MHRISKTGFVFAGFIFASLLWGPPWGNRLTWAQDYDGDANANPSQAGESGQTTTQSTDETYTTSETTTKETGSGYLTTEKFALQPMVGALVYTDANNSTTSRGAVGLGVDMNAASVVIDNSPIYIGPYTGVIFSHQGSASSDFWGTSPSADVNSTGANLFLIPANLKVGLNITDHIRVGAHGGGNVIYRSDLAATQLSTNEGTVGSHWGIYPNAGADVDIGLVRNVTITLRPDWTLTTGNKLFSGMLGVNFNIG